LVLKPGYLSLNLKGGQRIVHLPRIPGCNWVNADPLTQEMLAMALLLPGGHLGGLGGNARQVGGSGEGVLAPRLLTQLQPGYCTLVGQTMKLYLGLLGLLFNAV
jgi:hypothetical protein